jgi:threonine synthase
MKYISTRGDSLGVTFQSAILTGLAPDGGLYVPEHIPKVPVELLKSWSGLSYPQLAEKVVRLFISEDEIPSPDLTDIVKDAFVSFHHPDVLPIKKVGPYSILEMWHGPTGAFKDLAFALLARFVDYFLTKQGKKGVALVGTLGDTGSAAIHAFKDMKNTRLIVLFPKDSCHRLQRLQMTTVQSPFLRLYACHCPSDEFDTPIMKAFSDKGFATSHNLIWLNGINTGRFICQTINYIYAYLQMSPDCTNKVTFYVPSGGFANAAGGYQAQCMGLPINIVSVVNENDSFHKFMQSGKWKRPMKVIATHSCALDTVFPHNVERILYMMSNGNGPLIKSIMDDYYSKGVAVLPQYLLDGAANSISSERVTQDEAFNTAKHIWDSYRYTLCPHSAVAVTALKKHMTTNSSDGHTAICMATATGAKFEDFVKLFCDVKTSHPCVEGLDGKKEAYHEFRNGQDWEDLLKQAISELYEM